ncbi:hypothetical protein BU24DRAFT_473538 [Aaosphaeria arxii CBS 175.79]|uniref:Rhodopsin domain-containing protein n=1 Tax=Aaosphaeria arxii CBS 175.79 TaxID=1450172 RepID=A0A6A5X9F8_9PLEO|nr:uncharacterized protein BU24DRAFT_473538 [Aaosphaeria arxii CBS 175.79]KAF2009397.1 hypothetical protein BU24DRAFT_473538 [Aaosphaeria arxii CBS 175.79]
MLMATQSPTTMVCTAMVMLFVDTIAVSMRFKARRMKSQPFKADDWLSLLALALAIGLDVVLIHVLWTAAYLLAFIFACRGNFKAWWGGYISLITNCVNMFELLYGFAISDFVTDFIILVLPISAILSLHLPTKLKIGVLAIFLLGAIATVASMIRMISVIRRRQANFNPSFDQNLPLSIVACCLPVLNIFLRHEPITSSFRSFWTRLSNLSKRSQIDQTDSSSGHTNV